MRTTADSGHFIIMDEITFEKHVDSIDSHQNLLVIGLSNLEGNIWDGCIKILVIDTGNVVAHVPSPVGISMSRFCAEGKYVVSARDDGNLIVHTTESFEEIRFFHGHDNCAAAIADDTCAAGRFYSAGWDGSIQYWDIDRDGSVMSIPRAHSGHINDIARNSLTCPFVLASVGSDGFTRIWDNREKVRESALIFGVGQAGSCVIWDPTNENRFFVGTDSGDVIGFDSRNATGEGRLVYKHGGRVRRIRSKPSRPNVFLTASDDGSVGIFDNVGTADAEWRTLTR